MKNYLVAGLVLSLLFPLVTTAQSTIEPIINSTLAGEIFDSKDKTPLEGAVVRIKGTTHEVLTDKNGKFNFKTGQKFPYVLLITHIGYHSGEEIVNESTVKIFLQQETVQLNDVLARLLPFLLLLSGNHRLVLLTGFCRDRLRVCR